MASNRGTIKWLTSCQVILSAMVFWGQIQNYMMRINLSILIVAMVDKNATQASNFSNQCSANLSRGQADEDQDNQVDQFTFDWDEVTQGLVLSSFSYGYIGTQILGGRLAEKYGVKKVFGLSLLMAGVLTLITPPIAKLGIWPFMVLRATLGLCEGVTFPALHAMTARWVAANKRSSFIARSYFGTVFGLTFTFPLCGLVTSAYGWEAAFYTISGITFVWFIFWWVLVYDSPDKHPRISPEELEEIHYDLEDTVDTDKTIPVPWKAIFTSVPFYGVLLADVTNCFGITIFLYGMSKYLNQVQGFDLKTNGFLSALPFLCRYLGGVVTSVLSDSLLKRNLIGIRTSRKIFNSVATFLPAVCLILIIFAPNVCDRTYVLIMLCLGLLFNGSMSPGHFSSHVDLSPNLAGTLLGICNMTGNFGGLLLPVLMGMVLSMESMGMADRWNVIFGAASAIYVLGNFCFLLMFDGKVQSWNFRTE